MVEQPHFNFAHLMKQRNIQLAVIGFVVLNLMLVILGQPDMPISLVEGGGWAHVAIFLPTNFFYLVQVGLVYTITRKRPAVDFDARTPDKAVAWREIVGLWLYALPILIIMGGGFDIGLHLPGTIFDAHHSISRAEILSWTGLNFAVFAIIPYAFFRWRGVSNRDMGLLSSNRWLDLILILVVGIVESIGEMLFIPGGFRFFQMTPNQMFTGGAISLVVHLIGTGIPIMIFIQALLVPRYYKVSGSLAGTVIAGGLSYATFHLFEYWTLYDSATSVLLSLVFVYLQFTGAGMVKTMMTMRSGNAWTHVWGYHVLVPHVLMDTSLIVTAFGLR